MRRLFSFGWLALGGALMTVIAGCSPSNTNNDAIGEQNGLTSNVATTNATSVPTSTNSPVIPATPVAGAPPKKALASVWVPGAGDKLHSRPAKSKDPTGALNEIVGAAPTYFPPRTRVLSCHDDGKSVAINLNKGFLDPMFWSKRGELRTRLALYALVNSAATSGKPVVLEVEQRPIPEGGALGELDVAGPLPADTTLQAGSSATAPEGQSPAP